MSDKFIYQNARIKSMEVKLLSAQSMMRLSECSSLLQAFRTLLDMGFAAGQSVESCDFDSVFEYEEQRTVAFLSEFNVDGTLNAFLLQYDFLALKALIKANVSGRETAKIPYEGLYGTDTIKGWLSEEEPSKIPAFFRDVVSEVSAKGKGVTPHFIDALADRKMYECIFATVRKSDKQMRNFFARKADFANLLTFLRARKLGLPVGFLKENLVDGGEISGLDVIYDLPDEAIKDKLKGTIYFDAAAKALDDGKLISFEVAADNALLKMWRDARDDMFSEAPIVSYYLSRCTEIKVAKLIVAGLKNGVEQSVIRERMRDLYA